MLSFHWYIYIFSFSKICEWFESYTGDIREWRNQNLFTSFAILYSIIQILNYESYNQQFITLKLMDPCTVQLRTKRWETYFRNSQVIEAAWVYDYMNENIISHFGYKK